MSSRKIVRAPAKIPSEMRKDLVDMNQKFLEMNVQLKDNTNRMVEEIGRCLDELFTRLERVEAHCGLSLPPSPELPQTNGAQTEETATSTDTPETLSTPEQPGPEEAQTDQGSAS